MEVSRKVAVSFFLTIWQARGTPAYIIPTTSGGTDTNILPKNRCGKYALSVERKAYLVCLERFSDRQRKWR